MVGFYRPGSLKEALEIRRDTGAIPLAGGTDLLVRHRNWAGTLPRIDQAVVYIGHLKELRRLEVSGSSGNGSAPRMRIGAGVTYSELLEHPATPRLLQDSIRELAAPGLRNVATLVGNICNASPAADAVCALYALDAEVSLTGSSGTRTLPVSAFITGPGKTVLAPDELVTDVFLPLDTGTISYYRKVGTRHANALSKLSLCAHGEVRDHRVGRLRIAIGAVAPTIVRAPEIERYLETLSLDEVSARVPEILEQYAALIKPIDDQRSTAEYRKHTALALIRRFLTTELA